MVVVDEWCASKGDEPLLGRFDETWWTKSDEKTKSGGRDGGDSLRVTGDGPMNDGHEGIVD